MGNRLLGATRIWSPRELRLVFLNNPLRYKLYHITIEPYNIIWWFLPYSKYGLSNNDTWLEFKVNRIRKHLTRSISKCHLNINIIISFKIQVLKPDRFFGIWVSLDTPFQGVIDGGDKTASFKTFGWQFCHQQCSNTSPIAVNYGMQLYSPFESERYCRLKNLTSPE